MTDNIVKHTETHLSPDSERPALGIQSFHGHLYGSWLLHDSQVSLKRREE